jgi:hypothetical protein
MPIDARCPSHCGARNTPRETAAIPYSWIPSGGNYFKMAALATHDPRPCNQLGLNAHAAPDRKRQGIGLPAVTDKIAAATTEALSKIQLLWACSHLPEVSIASAGTLRIFGEAISISRHLARVYEQARQRHPRRWSRSTRCWNQPEVVWINPPPPENGANAAKLVMAG